MAGDRPGAGQEALELGPVEATRPVGRVEAAVRRATQAAGLTGADEGAAEVAAGLARGLDLALARRDPYAVAAIGKPLTEQLSRLHLDPQSRGAAESGHVPGDPWEQLAREVAEELKGKGASHELRPGSSGH